MADRYRPGDWYILCDATGRKVRRSDAIQQWDGAWVHKDFCDVRNPLDLPRTPSKPRPLYPVRPEPTDVFIDVDENPYGVVVSAAFTITVEAGSYVMTGTDVTLTNTTVTTLNLNFSVLTNSQYVPLVFANWM